MLSNVRLTRLKTHTHNFFMTANDCENEMIISFDTSDFYCCSHFLPLLRETTEHAGKDML